MKKLSDFIISYVTEASLGTGGSFYYMPATGGASAPTTAPAPATSYSPSVVSDNPDYDFQSRLGGMVKAKTKEAQDLLNRMKRVAARQEAGGGVDPGVASKIAELEDQLSPEGQERIRDEQGKKLERRIQRVKAGKQFSNLPSGMFKTTPKTPAEQKAYDAAKSAFDLMGKEGSEEAFEKSRQASAAVDAERKSASKISPVYQVTQGDFKTATGQDYDPRNPQHRQLFFDLAAKGSPTWSPTAGPGESPAYNTPQFSTMRGRPKNIPQFGTPKAWYDKVEGGALAPTTPESRARKQKNKGSSVVKRMPEIPTKPSAVSTSVPTAMPQDNLPFDDERGQFTIFPEQEIETTKKPEIPQVNLGVKIPEFKGYVVPESEAWNKLSEQEKLAMAAYALQRGEANKLFGGRQATQGGFLGIGGKKVNRFSEDNRGETPSETAFMNRVARMLNQMLDVDERKAKEAREFGPEVETGILQGESPVNLNSQTPKSVQDYLDKVLLRKYRKPSKSEKQGLDNFLTPEQQNQLFSGQTNKQVQAKPEGKTLSAEYLKNLKSVIRKGGMRIINPFQQAGQPDYELRAEDDFGLMGSKGDESPQLGMEIDADENPRLMSPSEVAKERARRSPRRR